MRRKTWVLGSVLMAFCLSLGFGCGGGGGEGMEDVLPPDFDNKADTASSKVVVKGPIAFGETKSAAFDTSKYHGYTFVGAKDASIRLTLLGNKAQKTDTVVLLYGPKAGPSWVGKPIAQDDNSAGNKFSKLSGFKLPASGEYLIIASCRNTSYKNKTYDLTLTCESGSCELQGETCGDGTCRESDNEDCNTCVQDCGKCTAAVADWTLLYFVSSDGDYPYDYTFNIRGLEAQGGSSEHVNVLMLYDAFGPGDSQYLIIGDSPETTRALPVPGAPASEVNMGDPKTYFDFIDWMIPRYPARHYYLSFHDHGSGALSPPPKRNGVVPLSILIDETDLDSLDPDEQGQVVAYLAERTRQPVDIVESMVCLGQMIENTFGMVGHAKYHIGAESLSYVTSTYPVRFLADHLLATPEEVALFVAKDHYQGVVEQDVPCTWSLLDLDKLANLSGLLGDLAGQLKTFADGPEKQELIRRVAGNAQNFSFQPGDDLAAYLDIKDLMLKFNAEGAFPQGVKDATAAIARLFEDGLIAFHGAHAGTHPETNISSDYSQAFGLSIYHPNSNNPYFSTTSSPPYESLGFSKATGWADYLKQIGQAAPAGLCPLVENLRAESLPDGQVLITWTYGPEKFDLYDAFFCSRDLNGTFAGTFYSIPKEDGKTSFAVFDNPVKPGGYTYRVSAFRVRDQEESLHWSRSNEITVDASGDTCSSFPLADGTLCHGTLAASAYELSVPIPGNGFRQLRLTPSVKATVEVWYDGDNLRFTEESSENPVPFSLFNPHSEPAVAHVSVKSLGSANGIFQLYLKQMDFTPSIPCDRECKPFRQIPIPFENSPYRLTSQTRYMFGRRELVQTIYVAAAQVATLAPGSGPVGTGDFSQADGAIPGSDVGEIRHPFPSHRDGFSADVAYYRSNSNNLGNEPACQTPDLQFCQGPHDLDLRRNILFMLAVASEPRLSQIIVDPIMEADLRSELNAVALEGGADPVAAAKLGQVLLSGIAYHTDHFHLAFFRECSDGIDNDGDRLIDMNDSGCSDPLDDSE